MKIYKKTVSIITAIAGVLFVLNAPTDFHLGIGIILMSHGLLAL